MPIFLTSASRHSHRAHMSYLEQLPLVPLNDPVKVHRAFVELAQHIFPLFFSVMIPLAILMDFIPPLIQTALTRSGRFLQNGLAALMWRLRFFNALITAQRTHAGWDEAGQQTIRGVRELHQRIGVPYDDPRFWPFHHGVLGAVFRSIEILEPLAWRRFLPPEKKIVHAWLALLAQDLGIGEFPKTVEALQLEMAGYEQREFVTNRAEDRLASRQLLEGLFKGLQRMGPLWMGWMIPPMLRLLLFTIAPKNYLIGFHAVRPRFFLPFSFFVLGVIRVGAGMWGLFFPYRKQPFDYNLLIKWVEPKAESGST